MKKARQLLASMLAIFGFLVVSSTVFATMVETPVIEHRTIGDMDALNGYSDPITGFTSELLAFTGDSEFPGDFTDTVLNVPENQIHYINFEFPGFTDLETITSATLQMNVGRSDVGLGMSPPRITLNNAAPGSDQIVGKVIGTLGGDVAYANYVFDLTAFIDQLTTEQVYFSLGFNYPTQSGQFSVDMFQLTALGTQLVDNSADTAPVPEPATMILLGTGLVGIVGASRKRTKKLPKA